MKPTQPDGCKPMKQKTIYSLFRKYSPSSQPQTERIEPQTVETNQEIVLNPLECDPGVRPQIYNYPVNLRDKVRLSYILLGPRQPTLAEYPAHLDGGQNRQFNESWFKNISWSHKTFTIDGFRNWKKVGGSRCALNGHAGTANSTHHLAMQQWQNLKNPLTHIDKVVERLPLAKIIENRLSLNTTVESVRFLATQGLAFRDNDESVTSDNHGKFNELVEAFGRNNPEVKRVLDNAHFNAKVCERAVVDVVDTKAQTLKDEICKVLGKYNLLLENMRCQGYHGASNMCGSWNGLQVLFLQECPYAYYVHCFTHRLQLALIAAAEEVRVVWRFFSSLINIVNFVGGSTKRSTELKLTREDELERLLDAGLAETGK
ncbi:uncharacterized protein LOC126787439 [Argentina anserina]|uniref:uncharacterized protein LOC126787439 n=1 Tax=Argentina anserina TaxID=57926 RepID=UPI0021762B79|nr:uncharacterized protein LOC126787439 [Potentilla anserina]